MKKDQKQKHYIFICHGKDCLKCGTKELQKCLERDLKNQPGKSNYELIKSKCMDHCKDGPSLVVDNIWYGKVTPKDLEKLLTKKAAK